jgi:hypothetical protein
MRLTPRAFGHSMAETSSRIFIGSTSTENQSQGRYIKAAALNSPKGFDGGFWTQSAAAIARMSQRHPFHQLHSGIRHGVDSGHQHCIRRANLPSGDAVRLLFEQRDNRRQA